MFVSNIPRRKIYEKMLIFEDTLIWLQHLTFSQERFEKQKEWFEEEKFELLKESFHEILATFVLFLENRAFETDEDFDDKINYYLKNISEVNAYLKQNKNIPKKFYEVSLELQEKFSKELKLDTRETTKAFFKKLDEFNSEIPHLLTLRRDEM